MGYPDYGGYYLSLTLSNTWSNIENGACCNKKNCIQTSTLSLKPTLTVKIQWKNKILLKINFK